MLLEWLIANGSPSAAEYAPQIPRVSVVSRCTCGCPTIDLAVDGKHLDGSSELVADFVGKSPEGIQVGVILHCRAVRFLSWKSTHWIKLKEHSGYRVLTRSLHSATPNPE